VSRRRLVDADPVLFDLDGTLTASGPGILASVRHALAELGEPIPPAEVLDQFIGPPLADSFAQLCGMDPGRAQEAITAYRVYFAARGQYENSVYDGIPEVLGALRDQGRVLAVATSKAEVFAESILAHFALDGYFAAVVGSELDGRRTDKAEVITEALSRLDRPRAGTVMIGDRSHDVRGARRVGVDCIGALWGYGSADELTTEGATALAETPSALTALLLP
jgi:phosphoglycolate phosphatase